MSLWVPTRLSDRDSHRDLLVRESVGQFVWFDKKLKELDPLLELVSALERIDDPQIVPGFWHVRRRNPGVADTYIPLCAPGGGFSEPQEWHLRELDERSTWRHPDLIEKKRKLVEEKAARDRAADREDRRGRMLERAKHHLDTKIVVPRSL